MASPRLQAYRKIQQAKHKASLTRENVIGAKRLAFELKNYGVDRVAESHFAADDAKAAANERSIKDSRRQITKEFEPKLIHNVGTRMHYTTRLVEKPDGTKELLDIKIVENYHDGQLTSCVETVL